MFIHGEPFIKVMPHCVHYSVGLGALMILHVENLFHMRNWVNVVIVIHIGILVCILRKNDIGFIVNLRDGLEYFNFILFVLMSLLINITTLLYI